MMKTMRALLLPHLLAGMAAAADPAPPAVASVSQHGVTWTFAEPRPAGRFVTGDWWVVGPVTVVRADPMPGPDRSPAGSEAETRSQYGATGMKPDPRMRNGSMIVARPGGKQGYDSRLVNYDPALSESYPLTLQPGQSLISSVSTVANPNPVLLQDIMWRSEARGTAALRSAAVLTCLEEPPPADAFRPPYAGAERPLLRAGAIRWEALPALAAAGSPPAWETVERWYERPWFDHIASWVFQLTGPQENQPNYGREFCRAGSIAALMLLSDAPRERKRTLMLRFVQQGIDVYGLVRAGRGWSGDGGHWNGRKLPLLFAAVALDDERLRQALADGLFSEDQQTYYGRGFRGDAALYQIVNHTGAKPPHEELDPATWDANAKRAEGYRTVCSVGWPGTALAVQLLGAKALWNHDAFFDYSDRWMADPAAKGLPDGKADAFVQAMWAAHRAGVPAQAGAREHRKWDWQAKAFVAADPPR